MNRVLNGVIGGWQLNTFVTFQSGQPLVFSDTSPITVLLVVGVNGVG